MLKATTHFEQVPLGLVMKIVEREKQIEASEEFLGKNQQDLSSVPAPITAKNGAEHE